MTRPVDGAMAAERPEKAVVRDLWLDTITSFAEAYPDDPHPLYVTLSGAEGKDIQLLIDHGLLELTETGAIRTDHQHRVVAVERNTRAVVQLQRRFPGLKILEQSFENLVRSGSPVRWPEGSDERFCCARVINLDLNEPLSVTQNNGEWKFPILDWVVKLCQIHAHQRIDWSLCVTLHGQLPWAADISEMVRSFLLENFNREPAFRDNCREWLGDTLFDEVSNGTMSFAEWSPSDQQRILMVIVPKKIAQMVHQQGWKVDTAKNLYYGTLPARAPMVTWIIDFVWDPRAAHQPDALYREALRAILSGAGRIEEDGSIS